MRRVMKKADRLKIGDKVTKPQGLRVYTVVSEGVTETGQSVTATDTNVLLRPSSGPPVSICPNDKYLLHIEDPIDNLGEWYSQELEDAANCSVPKWAVSKKPEFKIGDDVVAMFGGKRVVGVVNGFHGDTGVIVRTERRTTYQTPRDMVEPLDAMKGRTVVNWRTNEFGKVKGVGPWSMDFDNDCLKFVYMVETTDEKGEVVCQTWPVEDCSTSIVKSVIHANAHPDAKKHRVIHNDTFRTGDVLQRVECQHPKDNIALVRIHTLPGEAPKYGYWQLNACEDMGWDPVTHFSIGDTVKRKDNSSKGVVVGIEFNDVVYGWMLQVVTDRGPIQGVPWAVKNCYKTARERVNLVDFYMQQVEKWTLAGLTNYRRRTLQWYDLPYAARDAIRSTIIKKRKEAKEKEAKEKADRDALEQMIRERTDELYEIHKYHPKSKDELNEAVARLTENGLAWRAVALQAAHDRINRDREERIEELAKMYQHRHHADNLHTMQKKIYELQDRGKEIQAEAMQRAHDRIGTFREDRENTRKKLTECFYKKYLPRPLAEFEKDLGDSFYGDDYLAAEIAYNRIKKEREAESQALWQAAIAESQALWENEIKRSKAEWEAHQKSLLRMAEKEAESDAHKDHVANQIWDSCDSINRNAAKILDPADVGNVIAHTDCIRGNIDRELSKHKKDQI